MSKELTIGEKMVRAHLLKIENNSLAEKISQNENEIEELMGDVASIMDLIAYENKEAGAGQ